MASASIDASETMLECSGQPAATRRKIGAQPGNTYALKSGLRHGLTSGRLPAGCSGIRKSIAAFRKAIEKNVLEAKGEINLVDSGLINSAIRWERHALLSQRWLTVSFAELNHDQRLAHSREIAKASSERDKCLRELKIDMRSIGDAADSGPFGSAAIVYLPEDPPSPTPSPTPPAEPSPPQ